MHIFWTTLLGSVAFFWIAGVIELVIGLRSIPSLEDVAPLDDSRCPAVSILFAGRDEAEKLPSAIETLLSLDYPNYEVIAVDDRSEDGTGAILEAAARKNPRLKPVRVDSLPQGWLGKPHALRLVFTDADVHFAPDVLRCVVALAEEEGWEHLTLLGAPKMFTFGVRLASVHTPVAKRS